MQARKIQFLRAAPPSHRFAHRLLYFLVQQGAEYNGGEYPGDYWVIPENPAEQVTGQESDETVSSERLGDIVETYGEFDERSTDFAVGLAYAETDPPIHFTLGINPIDESTHYVTFDVPSNEIETAARFEAFVPLCRSVFETFAFEYGSHRGEYDDDVPAETAALRSEPFRQVTFLGEAVSDHWGAERLLDAPAKRTERLANGGVLVLVCTDPLGCPDDIRDVNDYIELEYDLD